MNQAKVWKTLAALTFMIVAIFLLAACGGCQGQSHASQKANLTNSLEQQTTTNADGTVQVTTTFNGVRSNTAISDATAPPAAKDSSTTHAGDTGADSSSGSSYAPPIVTIAQQNSKWIIATGIGFIIIGVFVGIGYFTTMIPWLKFTGGLGIAIGCEAIGGLLVFLPSIIEKVSPWAIGAFILVVVGAVVGGIIWAFKNKTTIFEKADDVAAKIVATTGNLAAASAARQATNQGYADKLATANAAATTVIVPDPATTIGPGGGIT